MPTITQGQDFPTLQAFKTALHTWAIEKGFTAAILDSDCHRVRAGCRSSPDCPFRIRANYNERRGHAKVTTVENVHTCTSATGPLTKQDIKRAETSKLKFLVEAVPKHMTVDAKTPTTAIIETVKEKYGQNIALRQAQKVKAILCPRAKQSCGHCGKNHASTARCPQPKPRAQPTSHGGTSQSLLAEDTFGLDFTFTADQPQQLHDFTGTRNPTQTSSPPLLSIAAPQTLPHPPQILPPAPRESLTVTNQPAPPIDPRLPPEPRPQSTGSNSHQVPSQTLCHPPQLPAPSTTPLPTHRPTGPPPLQPARTPQETRLEAARLMQNAARLMQEAARMNAEAARLTASVANF
ncbi:hypothetical protein MMC30_004210 [Trapelia coarctata]|nr:hypothetical protein [Trapelia coarctata]